MDRQSNQEYLGVHVQGNLKKQKIDPHNGLIERCCEAIDADNEQMLQIAYKKSLCESIIQTA